MADQLPRFIFRQNEIPWLTPETNIFSVVTIHDILLLSHDSCSWAAIYICCHKLINGMASKITSSKNYNITCWLSAMLLLLCLTGISSYANTANVIGEKDTIIILFNSQTEILSASPVSIQDEYCLIPIANAKTDNLSDASKIIYRAVAVQNEENDTARITLTSILDGEPAVNKKPYKLNKKDYLNSKLKFLQVSA
jgi:hypothetical protein